MNRNLILQSAIGAALTLAAGTAGALTTAPTAGNTVIMSGATATDRTLAESFLDAVSGICQNNNPNTAASSADVYVIGTAFDPLSPNTFRIDCNARNAPLAGTAISFGKNSGGSGAGVTGPANGATTAIPSRTCTGGPTVVPASGNLIGYRLFTSCTSASEIPVVGISDVEPAKLNSNATITGRLSTNAAAVVPMSIGVSRNLYAALQKAQFGAGTCASTVEGVGDDTAACVPSLSRQQVRVLLSNETRVVDPAALRSGAGAIDPPATAAALVGTAWPGLIYTCKRSSGSGTEISHQLLWFGEGCRAKSQLLATMIDDSNVTQNASGTAWTAGTDAALGAAAFGDDGVFSGTGAPDVEACLNWANANGEYAVGILSADRVPNDSDRQYRHVKVDGAVPSVEEVAAQRYAYWVENSVNIPNTNATNRTNYTTGNRQAITESYVLAALRNATVVGRGHVPQDFGRLGLLIKPTSTTLPSLPFVGTSPVNTAVRHVALDQPLENCHEPTPTPDLATFIVD
jgi:hypothetical protein